MKRRVSREKLFGQQGEIANRPAPYTPDWFDGELLRLGGLNPHGEPNLRARWGQDPTVTQFWCGRQLLVYHEGWVENHRITGAKVKQGKREFTVGREQALVLKRGERLKGVNRKAKVEFAEEVSEVGIGIARWMIERWQPTGEIDDGDWERNRYEWVSLKDFDPQFMPSGSYEVFGVIGQAKIDVLGPCPRPGRYTHMKTVETDDCEFRNLDQMLIREIEDHLRECEAKLRLTAKWRNDASFNRSAEFQQELIKEFGEKARQRLRDHRHLVFGDPVMGYSKQYSRNLPGKIIVSGR